MDICNIMVIYYLSAINKIYIQKLKILTIMFDLYNFLILFLVLDINYLEKKIIFKIVVFLRSEILCFSVVEALGKIKIFIFNYFK